MQREGEIVSCLWHVNMSSKGKSLCYHENLSQKKKVLFLNFTIYLKFNQVSLILSIPKDDWPCHVNMRKANRKQK